LFLHTKSSELH